MARSNTNRVLDNRLWDDRGMEWTREYRWLDRAEIDRHLAIAGRVVVHRFGAPLRWLSAVEARDYWRRVLPSTQFDNDPRSEIPEADGGLIYAAVEWRRGDERLLGFEESC
ncbi:MAG: hypothetical protein Q8K63_13625 [Acidimicrobiales bacterium]|nr:hypothetical protein [Acidimicrobiales bacterium]